MVVEYKIIQGDFYGSVSTEQYDAGDEEYNLQGMTRSVEVVSDILAEIMVGKDPTQQRENDSSLMQESNLPSNAVSAASIACCKAGAKQALMSVSDHIAAISDNSEAGMPATAFSIINGGHASASLLWIKDILIMPTGGQGTFFDRLVIASKIHQCLADVARDAGQEMLQRGARGGFCNSSSTFEQLMDCLMTAIETLGLLDNVCFVVDVHASKLIKKGGEDAAEQGQASYDLSTFCSGATAGSETKTASALLDIYLEWLDKYPIAAFVEPFAASDVLFSKELLDRGQQVLQSKGEACNDARSGPSGVISEQNDEKSKDISTCSDHGEGLSRDDILQLKVIADESVVMPTQVMLVDEQRGANALVINTAKISTVSECIALAGKARELGWTLFVSTKSEKELDGEFLSGLAIGLRAEYLLMGGLRSASTIAACCRMLRTDN